jgi:hypothetical protein
VFALFNVSTDHGLLDKSRFQRWLVCLLNPGALPEACDEAAPLALENYDAGYMQRVTALP